MLPVLLFLAWRLGGVSTNRTALVEDVLRLIPWLLGMMAGAIAGFAGSGRRTRSPRAQATMDEQVQRHVLN
jgi:hypothetical protein